MRTSFALALTATLLSGAASAQAATWRISVVPANIPLFDSSSPKMQAFSSVGAGGMQTLIAVGLPPEMAGYRVDLQRPEAAAHLPTAVQAKTVGASRSNVAWMIPRTAQTIVADAAFAEQRRLEAPRISPYGGIALAGGKLFGIGGFIEEPYDPVMGSRSDWMRQYARQDCAIFYVDLASAGREPHAVVCDKPYPTMFDRSALGQGFILATPDEKRVYALLERNMNLYIIPADKPPSARTVSLLRKGEKPYQLTSDDTARLRTAGFFFELRSRMRSPQGIVFGRGGTIAVIFREKGERSRFTADVFDSDGNPLASDIQLAVPEGGVRRFAEVVNLPSGEHFLFVSEPDPAFKKPLFQNLYRLELTSR